MKLPILLAIGACMLRGALALSTEAREASGFRAVNMFVGIEHKAPPLPRDSAGTWHAQAGQDRCVADVFDKMRDGFFVDLAANHPVYLSNTRTLERDFGWRGLCIDGNAELLGELARHRRCTVVGALVSAHADTTLTFRKFQPADWVTNASSWEHGLSGIVSPSWWQRLTGKSASSAAAGAVPAVDVQVQATTLTNILNAFNTPNTGIDYLSLDVEGAEWDVLRAFPFNSIPIRVLTVERPPARVRKLLKAHNFTYARDIGVRLDEMWLHGSMAHRLDAARAHNCPRLKCVVQHD